MKKITLTITCWLFILYFPLIQAQDVHIMDYKYIISFDRDKDEMTQHAKSAFEKRLSTYIQKEIIKIDIIGHTDERGSNHYNQGLSQRRADHVAGFLYEHGMRHVPLEIRYNGEHQPRNLGTNEEAWTMNRRVEVWFRIKEEVPSLHTYTYQLNNQEQTINEDIPETTNIQKEIPLTPYQAFHSEMDVEEQVFPISAVRGGIIQTKRGTIINFSAGEFCDCETQAEIQGTIDIHLREYYGLGDFMKAGFNTHSNQKILQSAGSLQLRALQDGKVLCLKKRGSYEILFPKNKMHESTFTDMQAFTGNLDENGEVNWGVMSKNSLLNINALNYNNRIGGEHCPSYARIGKSKKKFRRRFVDFFTLHSQWKDYRYWRSKKGRERARIFNERSERKYRKCITSRDSIVNAFRGDFEELDASLTELGANTDQYLFNYYILSSTMMGYINCDRFYHLPKRKKVLVTIPATSHPNYSYKLLLPEYNSIVRGSFNGTGFSFGELPKNKEAKLIVYQFSSKQPQMAEINFRIGHDVNFEDLSFNSYTMKELENYFSTLN